MDKKALTFLLCVVLVSGEGFLLHPQVDSFYLKALQEGKTFFHEGRYEQAVEDFKIAQFGLLEEKEHLAELYIYYALACFKLGKIEKAHTLIEDLKTKLNIKDPDALPRPAGIKSEAALMLSTLEKYDNPPYKTKKTGTTAVIAAKNSTGTNRVKTLKKLSRGKKPLTKKTINRKPAAGGESFDSLFRETLEKVKENHSAGSSKQVETNLKKLEKINKRDARLFYLKGAAAFNHRKYKDCIKLLETVVKTIGPAFREDVYYYLVRSYFFVKNYSRALVFYRAIQNPAYREKLAPITREIMEIRKRSIQQLSVKFSSRGLKTLIRQFPGDLSLCADILDSAIKANSGWNHISQVISQCEKVKTCSAAFIQEAAAYLKSKGKIEPAIKIIKKSKFYKSMAPNHVELHYQLGQLYLDNLELQKALAQMKKVKGIQDNYKKTDYIIEKIRFLINKSRRIP